MVQSDNLKEVVKLPSANGPELLGFPSCEQLLVEALLTFGDQNGALPGDLLLQVLAVLQLADLAPLLSACQLFGCGSPAIVQPALHFLFALNLQLVATGWAQIHHQLAHHRHAVDGDDEES